MSQTMRVNMREVRENDETDHQFSAVDSVSSQLFDRVTGTESLSVVEPSVAASLAGAPPAGPHDGPFSDVDNVSSQIFDRMHAIEQPDHHVAGSDPVPNQPNEAGGRMMNEGAQPNLQKSGVSAPAGWVLVRADDIGAMPLPAADAPDHNRQDAEAQKSGKRTVEQNDIGYRAAQRRSQLPDGVEPLEGAPTQVNEDSMHASIRKLMVEQKRDFNKSAFPELEPVDEPLERTPFADVEFEELSGFDDERDELQDLEQPTPTRFQTALVRFVRKDTVLAICLSVWVSLFLMIFIDPELSQALAIISLVLLGIFRIMHPPSKRRASRRKKQVQPPRKSVALREALLSQQ